MLSFDWKGTIILMGAVAALLVAAYCLGRRSMGDKDAALVPEVVSDAIGWRFPGTRTMEPSEAGAPRVPSEAGAFQVPSEAGAFRMPSDGGASRVPSAAGTLRGALAPATGALRGPSETGAHWVGAAPQGRAPPPGPVAPGGPVSAPSGSASAEIEFSDDFAPL